MYSYCSDEFIPLTMENILLRVTEEDIFSMVDNGKYTPDLTKMFISPFREDDNPGCEFSYYNDKLCFIDWCDVYISRDCIGFVKDYYNLSFIDTLKLINSHFKLGLGSSAEVKTMIQKKKIISFNKTKKDTTEIYYKTRSFYDADRIFWNRFHISLKQLEEDSVYPILWYKFFSEKKNDWVVIRPDDICYVYTEFGNNKVKIYRPYGPKKGKWLTNCTPKNIGGEREYNKSGEVLLWTKSYKDWRVVTNYGIKSRWVQSEAQFPSEKKIMKLSEDFETFIVLFDNDEVGIRNSQKFTDYINSVIPNKAFSITIEDKKTKDPSDMIEHNKEGLENFLSTNKLI